jgi:hypothetical protein
MATPNTVEGILAGAKDTLAKANKFTQSVTGNATDAFAPKHEFTNAPYHLARGPKPKTGIEAEAESAGKGIKTRMESEAAQRKALEQ